MCACVTAPCKSAQTAQPETGKVAFFQKQLARSDFRLYCLYLSCMVARPSPGRWIEWRHQGVPMTALSNHLLTPPPPLAPPPLYLGKLCFVWNCDHRFSDTPAGCCLHVVCFSSPFAPHRSHLSDWSGQIRLAVLQTYTLTHKPRAFSYLTHLQSVFFSPLFNCNPHPVEKLPLPVAARAVCNCEWGLKTWVIKCCQFQINSFTTRHVLIVTSTGVLGSWAALPLHGCLSQSERAEVFLGWVKRKWSVLAEQIGLIRAHNWNSHSESTQLLVVPLRLNGMVCFVLFDCQEPRRAP